MAPRKTTKPKPKPKRTPNQIAAAKRARAAKDAARQGKGAFTGKPRAGLIAGKTDKAGADRVIQQATAEVREDAKAMRIKGRDGKIITVRPTESGADRMAADRALTNAEVDQKAPPEYQEEMENRRARRLEREAGNRAPKEVGNPRAKTPATAAKALKPNTPFSWKGKEYLKKADGSVVEVPKKLAEFKASAISKEDALNEQNEKVNESRRIREPKNAAKKTAAPAKKATAKKATAKKVSAKATPKPVVEKPVAPKAKASPKPPAGETPANASGSKPVSEAKLNTAQAKVNSYTSQIKSVEDAMKNNRAALRSGAMSQAQFDAAKSNLTAEKNTLMKVRTEVAKAAGVDIAPAKAEEGSRPARNPQTQPKAKAVKGAAVKTEKPKVVKPQASKPAAPVESKFKSRIEKQRLAAAEPKAATQTKPKTKFQVKSGAAAGAATETKPVAEPKPKSKFKVKSGAAAAGNKPAATVGNKPATTATVKQKVVAEVVEDAVKKQGGGSARGLFNSLVSKFSGKKSGKLLKGAGIVGVVITAKDIFDAVTAYDRAYPPSKSGTANSKPGLVPKTTDKSRLAGGLTSNMSKDSVTGKGKTAKPKAKSDNKKTNALSSARYTAMANAYGKPANPSVKPTPPSTTTPAPSAVKGYRVKKGDTLYDIARKNNTTLSTIYKLNPTIKKRKDAGKVDIFANTLVRLPKK
jgi:LysM repeat protein